MVFVTHNNKSSLGPLIAVTLGPIDSLFLFHGDLNIGLPSDSLLLILSLEIGVAGIGGLLKMNRNLLIVNNLN